MGRRCGRACNKRWRERTHAERMAYDRERRDMFPERAVAWNLLGAAVRRGKVKKPASCPRCGTSDYRIEAHHPDYNKPLEVVWLCARCHSAEHGREVNDE